MVVYSFPQLNIMFDYTSDKFRPEILTESLERGH